MPDGATKHLQLVAHATRDTQGRLEYLGAVQDVTQRRASEEALTRARTELANVARTTSLGVLTAAIAHEVNQPISAIITNANTCFRMLAAQPPNIDGAVETARRTIRDGKRAADVIARLRTLYTRKDVQPELMDLNEATREVASLSLSELQRNGVVLRYELADDLPPVKGDRIQLQQVILNLLRNASDAMSTINDRPKELLVRTEAVDGDSVRLSVKDAGVGLSAEAAKRIFDPFYTTKSDGMGIGLSVSRSIIEAHYGSLWATPNEGPGVTFAFSLPLESGHARTAPPDVGNPPGAGINAPSGVGSLRFGACGEAGRSTAVQYRLARGACLDRSGDAAIELRMQHQLPKLLRRDSVGDGPAYVGGELHEAPAADEHRQGEQTARLAVESGSLPYLAKTEPGDHLLQGSGEVAGGLDGLVRAGRAKHLAP
jgi:signal transduction histidine kinase